MAELDACQEAILFAFSDIHLMGIGVKDMVSKGEIDISLGIGFEHVGPAIARGRELRCHKDA